ncbi:MAG: stage II sporulation protein M [archaeon]|nr:stage II sporulation protein M [archaeon]
MVLESLASLSIVEKRPISLLFVAFLVTSVGMFAAYRLFPESSAVLTIAFTTLVFMPIMHSLFIKEEEGEVDEKDVPFAFIATHFNLIKVYTWIFIGMIVAFSFWAVMLPEANDDCSGFGCFVPDRQTVFSEQKKVYSFITGKAVGTDECFSPATSGFGACFELIFANNLWVLVLAIIFSFIWGAGALFLLGWQASVIGYFIGLEITSKSLEAGLLRAISFLPHGIPEIMAYFIAALAGGIISVAISKQKFKPHEIRIVLVDTVLLLLLAAVTLLIGAFIETAAILEDALMATLGMTSFALLYFILYIPSVRYKLDKIRKQHAQTTQIIS